MAFLSLALAAAVGWFGVGLWVPGVGGGSRWAPVLRGSLGIGLGMGALSCLYFLLAIAGLASLPVVGAVEAIVLLATGGAYLIRRREAASASPAPAEELPAFPWNWALGLAAAGMAALFVASFLNVSELNPQGGWDAFAIWGLRAHYLTHSETWRYAVTAQSTGAHMEYPLLLSSFIARGWLYDGGTSSAVPIAIAMLVPLALATLLSSTLSVLRSTGAGLLAFSILLAHPGFLNAAADQYADLPLAFFSLSAAALLALDSGSPRYLTLAGWFAAFAAWTKNEGLLVVVALAAALLVSAGRSSGWRAGMRQCGLFLLGALPVVVLVLWFKLFVAPPDPLAHGLGTALLRKISDAGRWTRIAAGLVQGAPVVALLLVAFAAGLLRFAPAGQRRPGMFLPLIACAIVLAGDFAVFLLTPDDLNWLLSTALERLYLQLWPLLLLAVFLLLRRPEDFALAIAEAPPKRSKSHRAH